MTEPALIVAGHGSHRNPDSAAPVHRTVERLRERGTFAEVRPAFWKEAPSLRDAVHTVDADEAVVVPLFVSEGYFVERVLPREFGLGERDPLGASTVRLADPVGTHAAMTDVIAGRAERLLDGPPDDVALAVIGHGTERNPNSADAIHDHVAALRERGTFAEVGALFMDEPPYVEDVREAFDADEIAVVPLFIADGFHTQDEIPELLGLTDDAQDGYPVPAAVGDRRIRYASAVGTDPLVADVVVERAAEAGAAVETPADVERPVPTDAAEAFVGWVETADEGGREWGELAVTAADGGYDLRHRDDRGVPTSDLDELAVGELRERVRRTDGGRYRPFAGERTLPRGWVVRASDRDALLRAAATVYPAGIEHWAAEQAGDLDPVDFRAVADRQTGIYESVADCSPAEVAGTVAACCGNCAKRRTWDAGDAEPATDDAAAADSALPCREPCSFVVAAAREFREHESPADRSEPPADPDGDVPRGDLTDPANVYRVRYRRARRQSDR